MRSVAQSERAPVSAGAGGSSVERRMGGFADNERKAALQVKTMNAETRTSLPKDRELVLRVMPLPADSNANGDIFGGWIMAQVDLAGSVLPSRIARGRIAEHSRHFAGGVADDRQSRGEVVEEFVGADAEREERRIAEDHESRVGRGEEVRDGRLGDGVAELDVR